MTIALRPSDATNLAGQDTGRDTLSHSKLSLVLACARKYELHYEKRLELIARPRPLSLGSAFQKAIEFQDPEAGVLALQGHDFTVFPDGMWVANPPEEPVRFYSQEQEDQHRIDCATVRAAAALYLRRWPAGSGEAREVEFRVRLRSPWTGAYSNTFDLLGYADGVVDHYNGNTYVTNMIGEAPTPLELIENKLVGRVDALKVQRLPLDRQLALERYGLWRATGRHVQRVHYRWVKKPSIKPRGGRKKDRSDAETIDQFIERLEHDYTEREDFYVHEEQPKWATTEDLLRIEAELWTWAQRLRDMRRQRLADRNTARCTDFGGCQFLPICTGDPDAMSLYRVRPERDVEVDVPLEATAD